MVTFQLKCLNVNIIFYAFLLLQISHKTETLIEMLQMEFVLSNCTESFKNVAGITLTVRHVRSVNIWPEWRFVLITSPQWVHFRKLQTSSLGLGQWSLTKNVSTTNKVFAITLHVTVTLPRAEVSLHCMIFYPCGLVSFNQVLMFNSTIVQTDTQCK